MQEQITDWLRQWHLAAWGWNVIIIALSVLFGLLLELILSFFVRRQAKSSGTYSMFRSLIIHLGVPFTWFFPLFLFNFLLPVMRLPVAVINRVDKIVEILLTILFAWILIRLINVVQDYVLYRFDITKSDNLRERKIRTQLQFIRRILIVLIVVVTLAVVLLSFSAMRKIGAGLLTGVGLGGIIIGFAAQRSLANLLAGFQIAFTQPIRIDDAVVVEGEFGYIEEINLTYVVVRIWDERRLVLPINYFIEKPFQNWTRNSAELLGSVMIYTDYSIPVDELRKELTRLLLLSPLWDGRINGLQVTNTTDRSIEIRALMSAANSGNAFDLRCFVREKLIDFIKKNYPESLPKTRIVEPTG